MLALVYPVVQYAGPFAFWQGVARRWFPYRLWDECARRQGWQRESETPRPRVVERHYRGAESWESGWIATFRPSAWRAACLSSGQAPSWREIARSFGLFRRCAASRGGRRLCFGKAVGAKRVAMFLNRGQEGHKFCDWSKEKEGIAQAEQIENETKSGEGEGGKRGKKRGRVRCAEGCWLRCRPGCVPTSTASLAAGLQLALDVDVDVTTLPVQF